ncbi:MAG: mechanosensitive ion channel domain-containing protein [Calditrichaceae bacterium]
MKQIFELPLSQFAIIKVLIFAFALFLIIKLFERIAKVVFVKRIYRLYFQRYYPILETVVWLLFVLWSIDQIFKDRLYYSVALILIILVTLVWISWFAVRDFIAGIIFKAQDVYEAGQWIKISEIEGRLKSIGYLSLEIEIESGEIIKFPYSKITGVIHSISDPEEHSNHHRFEIELNRANSLKENVELLRRIILNSPWTLLTKAPQIQLLEENENHFVFEIFVYSISKEFFRHIENDVKSSAAEVGLSGVKN